MRCFPLSVHNSYSASCYGNHIRSASVVVRQIMMIVATKVYGFLVAIRVCLRTSKQMLQVLVAYITEVQRQSNGGSQKYLDWSTGMDHWTDVFCTKNQFYGL